MAHINSDIYSYKCGDLELYFIGRRQCIEQTSMGLLSVFLREYRYSIRCTMWYNQVKRKEDK